IDGRRERPVSSQLGRQEVVMFTSKTKVLLILTRDVLHKETTMSNWMRLTILAVGMTMILGCSQQPSGTAAMIEDKTYSVTPASVTVKAGIVTGEVTEMKVTERVEKGSDRVVSPAKLTGTLKLRSEEHTSELQSRFDLVCRLLLE